MKLSAPTMPVFLISLIIAIVVAVVHYVPSINIPWVSANSFLCLAIAYIILLAGNVMKGI